MEVNGKSIRLQTMLQEALNPLIEKQEALEKEIKALRLEQQDLKNKLVQKK